MVDLAMGRELAKVIANGFGGEPRVDRFWDADDKTSVDVLQCSPSPINGVTSYATLGVSFTPVVKDGRQLPIYTELIGACGTTFTDFPNCLATAAFNVLNTGWSIAPGIVFRDVVRMYRSTGDMNDLLFVPPFLWSGLPTSVEMDDRKVSLLLAVPISTSERRYAVDCGVAALEKVFEQAQIDIFNLDRSSVALDS
ncbi:MAG: suppressor of fused domain protein [Myxococcota bacterium]